MHAGAVSCSLVCTPGQHVQGTHTRPMCRPDCQAASHLFVCCPQIRDCIVAHQRVQRRPGSEQPQQTVAGREATSPACCSSSGRCCGHTVAPAILANTCTAIELKCTLSCVTAGRRRVMAGNTGDLPEDRMERRPGEPAALAGSVRAHGSLRAALRRTIRLSPTCTTGSAGLGAVRLVLQKPAEPAHFAGRRPPRVWIVRSQTSCASCAGRQECSRPSDRVLGLSLRRHISLRRFGPQLQPAPSALSLQQALPTIRAIRQVVGELKNVLAGGSSPGKQLGGFSHRCRLPCTGPCSRVQCGEHV